MQDASCTVPGDIRATIVRILAYMGALAILAIAAASLFRAPAGSTAVQPAPLPEWISIDRPRPAFDMQMPELAPDGFNYAILRRNTDSARKDVLSWGEPASGGPYVMVEIYRPGAASERFIDAPSEIAARIVGFTITDDVKPAGAIDSKFGAVPLVDFAIAVPELTTACSAAASASRGRSTIRRCKSPAGIAARANSPSTAQRWPARSTGSPSCPPAATLKSPACSRAPNSSAPSAASATRSWRRRRNAMWRCLFRTASGLGLARRSVDCRQLSANAAPHRIRLATTKDYVP